MGRKRVKKVRGGTLVIQDLGLEEIQKNVLRIAAVDLTAGVIGPRASEIHPNSNITMAQLMAVHEFGTFDKRIPQRAPIRRTITRRARSYNRWLEKQLGPKVFRAKQVNAKQVLDALGDIVRDDIKATIAQGLTPPLKDSTVEARIRRGNPPGPPLDETGALVDAIESEVVKK